MKGARGGGEEIVTSYLDGGLREFLNEKLIQFGEKKKGNSRQYVGKS